MGFLDRFGLTEAGNRCKFIWFVNTCLLVLIIGLGIGMLLASNHFQDRQVPKKCMAHHLSLVFSWIAYIAQTGILGFIVWRATTPITHTAGKAVTHLNLRMFGINVFRISWIRPQHARDGPAGPVAHLN